MALLPFHQQGFIEAGCDEAGRGCLAGSVFAAAVILPTDFFHPWLNDSKQITEKQRDTLREVIEKESIAWAVAEVSPTEIDKMNILKASLLAMHRALDALSTRPDFILVDGNRFHPYPMRKELGVPLKPIQHRSGCLLPGYESPVFLHHPTKQVGIDPMEQGIQRRLIIGTVVHHPAPHYRIDFPCQLGRCATRSPMQPPGPHLLTYFLQGLLANGRQKRRKTLAVFSARFAWPERVT